LDFAIEKIKEDTANGVTIMENVISDESINEEKKQHLNLQENCCLQ
jgi:hypothetical protein